MRGTGITMEEHDVKWDIINEITILLLWVLGVEKCEVTTCRKKEIFLHVEREQLSLLCASVRK